MTKTPADRIREGIAATLTTKPRMIRGHMAQSGHGIDFDITGIYEDGRILVTVTNLGGLRTAVRIGETLAIPADRIVAWTSR